jgi:peptide/nickel transport system permease protein
MSVLRLLAKRAVLGFVAIWTALSTIFVLFQVTDDWRMEQILARQFGRGSNAGEEQIEAARQAYLAERGLDKPTPELYVDWMTNMFTLQWGQSFESGREVLPMVVGGISRTAAYVVPAIVLAGVFGLAIGLVTAAKQRSRGEGTVRSLVYLGMGVPNFWLGGMLLLTASGATLAYTPTFLTGQGQGTPQMTIVEWSFLYEHALPTLLVASTLTAAMVSYARAYSLQYYADDLTKLVRAKGGGRIAVARHVVRNAAVPLVSLLFAETLALIALSVFVIEAVFAIDGIGSLFYNAVWVRDLPILLGGTMVIVAVGVIGNTVQELVYAALDPRVDAGN